MKYEDVFMRQMDEKDRKAPPCLLLDQAPIAEGPGGADQEPGMPPRCPSSDTV